MRGAISPVVLLVGMSGPVAVANVEVFYGGNELYKWCSKELAAFESSFCGGFVTGVTDSMLYGSVYGFRSCHSKDGTRRHVGEASPHEELAEPVTHSPCQDPSVARAHGSKVDEANALVVPAAGSPARHSATVAIDAIPHNLTYKTTNLIKAG